MRKKFFLMAGWLLLSCITVMAQAPGFYNEKEAEVYNKCTQPVQFLARMNTGDQLAELINKHKIAPQYQTGIMNIIHEREFKLAVYNFMYPDDYMTRYKLRTAIIKQYQDTLTRALLKAGAAVSSYNYNLAIKNKDLIGINNVQLDSIIKDAVAINRVLDRRPGIATWGTELKTFNRVFSQKQMDDFLTIKNFGKAKRNAMVIWNVLKDNNMIADLDSATTINQLHSYYNNIERANDLYIESDSLKKSALEGVNIYAPLAMKRYWAFRKLNRTKNSYKGTYAW
jgi:hypothetical protein